MKLFITGGAGFIGSNLIEHALAEGHEVLNFDKLTYAGNPASLEGFQNHPSYQFWHADIGDGETVAKALRDYQPDTLIHLAAETHVDRSIDAPARFVQTNVNGTLSLLETVRHYLDEASNADSFRFLHVSTDEVFGSLGESGTFKEDDCYAPRSPYAASKAASDHLVRAWGETYGLPAIVAHASNCYGPRQFPEKLIPLVILKALRGESIPVYGDGHHVRDWLYVGDLLEALLILSGQASAGESYTIGGGNEWRNIDLIEHLCSLLDQKTPKSTLELHSEQIRFVPDRPGHDFRYALDRSKIEREFAWSSKVPIESGLNRVVDWYLKHDDWWQPIVDGTYQLTRLGLR